MTNKTLGEIIESVRSGERPDYDDLRYAICALSALSTFDFHAIEKLAEAEMEGEKPFLTTSALWQLNERHGRIGRALEKPPKDYVGWNNDPDNPDFQKRRKANIKIFEKFMNKEN